MSLTDTSSDFEASRAAQFKRRHVLKVASRSPNVLEQSVASITGGVQADDPKQDVLLVDVPKDNSAANTEAVSILSTHELGHRKRGPRRSVRRAPRGSVEPRFWLLNRWHGEVLAVGLEDFRVKLTDPAHPDVLEITHFSKSELSEESLAALRPGANFYWMVGYKDHGSRQRERQSVIFMRRGGRMSREKFQHELQAVDEVWGEFERDTENAACIE